MALYVESGSVCHLWQCMLRLVNDLPSIRERTRRAVQLQIRADAMGLFETQGFRATTVDQIARAAGVSVRTFFRYFETKEDVLVGDADEQGEVLLAAFSEQSGQSDVWTRLQLALMQIAEDARDPDARRVSAQIVANPELRARHLEKQGRWRETLFPAVTASIGGPSRNRALRAESIIGAALACFDAAVSTWTRAPRPGALPALVAEAMQAVAQAPDQH